MRRNKTSDADTISVKVGKLISETRAHQLSNVNYKDVKKLWASVRSTTAHSRKESLASTTPLSANDFVDFFTDIATDPTYDFDAITETINCLSRKLAKRPINPPALLLSMSMKSSNTFLKLKRPHMDLTILPTGFLSTVPWSSHLS